MPVDQFPLDFRYEEIDDGPLRASPGAPFMVGTMFTQSHSTQARRLVDSCKRFNLSYAACRVPTVHRSISSKGSDDLRYTKANFVHFLLQKYGMPCLYLDADCYFQENPSSIASLVQEGHEFAVYNWLADRQNEAYLPFPVTMNDSLGNPVVVRDRFYAFSHSVDYFATDQLLCSGGVQLYGPTDKAKNLLRLWQGAVAKFPGAGDDHCMDFAFNNGGRALGLKVAWLDKSYMRCPWWIYVRPVINHPDFPNFGEGWVQIEPDQGRRRVYMERTQARTGEYVFPKDCVIDARERLLVKLEGNQMVLVGSLGCEIWV